MLGFRAAWPSSQPTRATSCSTQGGFRDEGRATVTGPPPQPLNSATSGSATYEITYEIRGDESGPVIERAELTEQTSLSYTPSSISTASARTKVSVKITDIQKQ